MKHYIFLLLMLLTFTSCSANEPEMPEQSQPVQPGEGATASMEGTAELWQRGNQYY